MAEEVVLNIKIKKEGADNSVKDLTKEVKKADDSTNKLGGSLDKVSGGAATAFSTLRNGIRTAITGFKSLKFAIAATGIGLLIIGLVAVKKAFENTEEGQNKFAKIMGVIGSITGNFIDLIASLGRK